MSANVVNERHIDAVVTAICGLARRRRADTALDVEHDGTMYAVVRFAPPGSPNDAMSELTLYARQVTVIPPQVLGELLLAENVASVNYRYDEQDPVPDYRYRFNEQSVIQAIKAIHCLEYQSCEHPGWDTSLAKKILDLAMHRLTQYLVGYSEAVWELVA